MRRTALAGVVLLGVVAACGGDDPAAEVGGARADQLRAAALEAGLDPDVADFLALLGRAETESWTVAYPGVGDGAELVVTSSPPDRRVDVVSAGRVTEVRLVLDGEALACSVDPGLAADPAGPDDPDRLAPPEPPAEAVTCERTDAFVDPVGTFREGAVEELRDALAERLDDFSFEVRDQVVAGVEARCLVTAVRAGRERPELASGGTVCAAPTGTLLLVDQGGERIEATAFAAEADRARIRRPDVPPGG